MAEYHLNAKTCSRGTGKGAGGHARYILRAGPYAERAIESVEGSTVRRQRVSRTDELAATHSAHLPAWAQADPLTYWDAADRFERANGTVYRELEFALPAELSEPENTRLAIAFAEHLAHVQGGATPYTLAVHRAERDPALLHCHLLLSDKVHDGHDRDPALWFKRAANPGRDPALGGAPKTQSRIGQDWLAQTVRPLWAELANKALEHAGHDARIDHRTLDVRRQEQERLAGEARARGDDLAAARHQKAAAALDKPAQPKRGRVLDHGGPDKAPGQAQAWARHQIDLVERARAVHAVQEAEAQVQQSQREILQHRADLAPFAALNQALAAIHTEPARPGVDQEDAPRPEPTETKTRQQEADPAAALSAWLALPPIARRGSMEGISRQSVLENVATCQAGGMPPAGLLGEAEQAALRQAHWIDRAGDLTPKGQSAVQWHQAQQARQASAQREQDAREKAAAATRAAETLQRRADEQARQQTQHKQEQERLDAQTTAGAIDGIRAPRRTPADWQQWRARVLTQAYGDQIEAAALARDWRVTRAQDGQPLTLWGTGGQSIEDYGDRICPSGDDRWGHALQDATLRTALQLAQLKGWGQPGAGLDITGSSAFRERAARMATDLGIPVSNADLQPIVAAQQARQAQQQAPRPAELLAAIPTETVDRSAPHAAKPAPAQKPPAVPVKQAEQADPIRAEALQYLGEKPAWRQSRWDDLVKRTSAPPQPQQHLDDPKAALAAWQADRTQRGRPNAGTDRVHERCTRYGWTAEDIRNDWQRQVDETEQRRAQLERSGWRLFGRNSHAKEVDELHAQAQQMIKVGNAEIALASDWETFKPKAIAQEHAQREAAWQKDVALKERIAPHALAILEQDRQAAERAKAAKQVERAERQKAQQRSPARQESPDSGMGMG